MLPTNSLHDVNYIFFRAHVSNHRAIQHYADTSSPKTTIQKNDCDRPLNNSSTSRPGGSSSSIVPSVQLANNTSSSGRLVTNPPSVRPTTNAVPPARSVMPSTRPVQYSQEQHLIHMRHGGVVRQEYCGTHQPVIQAASMWWCQNHLFVVSKSPICYSRVLLDNVLHFCDMSNFLNFWLKCDVLMLSYKQSYSQISFF